ncbi:MAG: S46 family peptidase [Bacteroidales bacterium]|nr:S46 family peptidase [Bacteroidales bacterium]
MKIRTILAALLLMAVAAVPARADEGMWLLSLLGRNYADMQKAGLKLSPEDIYSINQNCLKDAIVGLGNEGSPFSHFCTGEIISTQGLMSTNHHCGYGKLQEHSTVEHDYLRDGFWAYSKDQELPNPGLTASILVRMEDVTDRIQKGLSDDMSEGDRAKAIERLSKEIASEAAAKTGYAARVKPMFNGNQFFLFIHIIYKDVRLVGAPPSSMGKFGGDTDNWSWPRHTCDFSLFRIYTAPDGSPAEYSKDNIPLKPKHSLPVSIRDLHAEDFAMVMGFPGTTDRFLTSYGLKETMDINNTIVYRVRSVKIRVLKKQMSASRAVRIKYASKYASCSNYWKYSNEQNKALTNLGIMKVKQDIEAQYLEWAKDKDPKYTRALDLLREAYEYRAPHQTAMTYIAEGLLSGTELPFQSFKLGYNLLPYLKKGVDEDDRLNAIEKTRKRGMTFYKDYDMETEREIFSSMCSYVYSHIESRYCPKFLEDAHTKYKGDFKQYASYVFSRSVFATQASFEAFMQKPDAKRLESDPLYQAGKGAYEAYRQIYESIPSQQNDNLERGQRDFVDGIMQINQGKKLLCPDANSTIRFTYGNVRPYDPRDAVSYSFYTTLRGVMEKENPRDDEFNVPARLKELYKAHDFGQYANPKGELPTCFLTTNDITGGNSGSPVISADGCLIGLAFDGNGEAMSGDINFETNLQRCICLDSRYMLFVIDKFAGAQNLIDEMNIVR